MTWESFCARQACDRPPCTNCCHSPFPLAPIRAATKRCERIRSASAQTNQNCPINCTDSHSNASHPQFHRLPHSPPTQKKLWWSALDPNLGICSTPGWTRNKGYTFSRAASNCLCISASPVETLPLEVLATLRIRPPALRPHPQRRSPHIASSIRRHMRQCKISLLFNTFYSYIPSR